MTEYCEYCNKELIEKGYKADGKRYHLVCVRKLRKEIEKQKRLGKVKHGQEQTFQTFNS